MKYRKFFMRASVILGIFLLTGLISACLIAKPIELDEKEITYYTNVAKKVWYEGLNTIEKSDDVRISINLDEKEIKVEPLNANKQSVTVSFKNSEASYVINKPVVSFWGCFFFYGIVFTCTIYITISLILFALYEIRL